MDFEAIVIGSGFGGSVAALRLGEARVRTLVLERGRRWPIVPSADTFATSTNPDGRSVWLRTSWGGRPVARYVGVRDVVEAPGMTVVQGAGVGGGSLVHAAITYQPNRKMFFRSFGDAVDYGEMERVYYPRVRSVLNSSPIPDDVLDAPCSHGGKRFLTRAMAAGFVPRKLELAVDWNVVREELAGKCAPSFTAGEFTTNSGAKNSLDRNYLPRAEATGFVEVRPLHRAAGIAETRDGFHVAFERLDETGTVSAAGVLGCRHLFLAAGALGTSELLLRAQATGTLSRVNDRVGTCWGTNGDRFVPLEEERRMVTGAAFEHFDNPHGPVVMEDMPNVRFAITLGATTGTLRYDPARGGVTLDWPSDDASNTAATRAAEHTNDLFEARTRPSGVGPCVSSRTVHPLGGAVIGEVCDSFGRVFGYNGLYVVDGALVPGNCGCANPSLTIAGLAERAMDRIVVEHRLG